MDLLRWWRFLHAVEVSWDRVTRVDARDFSCWIQLTVQPRTTAAKRRPARSVGAPDPVTGKMSPGLGYAPSTVAHSETVLRRFCDLHRDAGSGPLINPFPLDLARRSGRAHAHHNPMDAWLPQDHLARSVADLVDDVPDLGPALAYCTDKRGCPPYDPRLMLRLLIYGCTTGVRSLWAIERKHTDDMACRFLAAGQTLGFRSISRFRRHLTPSWPCSLSRCTSRRSTGMVKTGRLVDKEERGPRRVATAGCLPQPAQDLRSVRPRGR